MKQHIIYLGFSVLTVSILIFAGCKKEDPQNVSEDKTTFNMRMTDSPGDYQEVNVNVIGAEVNSEQSGWISLDVKAGIYNLLKLTNGIDTLIANGQVTVGNVSQIRLILGENNTIKIDNQIYPLSTPSASQSGLKLQVHCALVKGVAYNLSLDFDAAKSIVLTGSNTYELKPVIRVITTAFNGGINGIIIPAISQPAIYAIMGTDTVGTFADQITGEFLIQGLAAGNYKVVIMPKTPYSDSAFVSVPVVSGGVTAMGAISIH
jgi:hypothetical protein